MTIYESMERYLKNLANDKLNELAVKQKRWQDGKMSQEELNDLSVYEKQLFNYMKMQMEVLNDDFGE